jgi:uncharacterized protein YigA (DUF484 family)
MKTKEFFTVSHSSRRLNESLMKTFGKKINFENFNLAQLQDAQNKLRTQISQMRNHGGFNENLENEVYHKAQWMLDAINAQIAEREEFIVDNTDESEPKNNKLKKTDRLAESELQQATTVVTANTMSERITRWIEDLSGMENDTMIDLGDAIRDEYGQAESEQFISTVAPAIEQALETLKSARKTVKSAVYQLVGDQSAMLGDEEPAAEEPAAEEPAAEEPAAEEPAAMDDQEDLDDAFAAADAAVGGSEVAGREKRESINRSTNLLRMLVG